MTTLNSFPIETKRIAELSTNTSLEDSDLFPMVNGGVDKNITGEVLKDEMLLAATNGSFCIESGAANAYIFEPLVSRQRIPALQRGMVFYCDSATLNDSACTINVHGTGTLPIVNIDGDALSGGEIKATGFSVRYDLAEDRFILLSQQENNNEASLFGTGVFSNATNNLNLSGLGLIEGLEIGDVYKFAGTTNNNGLYTAEVITDNDNVIFNLAHAGKTSSKSFTDETTSCEVTLVSKKHNAPLGLGQGWCNVSLTRSNNVNYTNNTGRPIIASAQCLTGVDVSIYMYVDSISITNNDGNPYFTGHFNASNIVTDGSIYRIFTSPTGIRDWFELR